MYKHLYRTPGGTRLSRGTVVASWSVFVEESNMELQILFYVVTRVLAALVLAFDSSYNNSNDYPPA